MENSRRPYDRPLAKDPLQKKPRLTEIAAATDRSSNVRTGFVQRQVASNSSVSGNSSFEKDVNRKNGDSARAPLPQQPSQPHQELVSQYKTALAELTFNSKPIITNLTIIAGENLHAAKAIAATVCANILEVPSEQKLPSLYLLDSIVKNIGRDYIKSFASRLPEVFCQAYRLVDPSVHQAMRHLFGTWKGVFPPQVLEMIEKELRFNTIVIDSSDRLTSRTDSFSQHHAPSIHVNPKYLEARQHLHTTRERAAGSEISRSLLNSVDDVDVPPRNSGVSSGNSQFIQHQPRDFVKQSLRSTSSSTPLVDSEYGYSLAENSRLGTERVTEISKVRVFDRSWCESGSDMTGKVSNQKNDFDTSHGYESHGAVHKSVNSKTHIQQKQKKNLTSRSNDLMSGSWKNSDEEEYVWDEMSSRPTDHSEANTLSKDHRISLFTSQLPPSPSLSANSSNSLLSNSSERNKTSTRPPADPRKPQGLRNTSSIEQYSQDSLPLLSQTTNRANTQKIQPKHSMSTSTAIPNQQQKHVISTHQRNLEFSGLESSNEHNLFLPQISGPESRSTMINSSLDKVNPHSFDSTNPGQSVAGSFLDAVAKSGILRGSSLSGSRTKQSFLEGGSGSSHVDEPLHPIDYPQMPEAASSSPNPFSSLLSSLVSKGLISSSKSDPVSFTSPNASEQPLNRASLVASTSSTLTSSLPIISVKPSSITDKPSLSDSATKLSDDLPWSVGQIKNVIGFEFKSDVIRNFHPNVVEDLSDLQHQCSICRLNLKCEEQLDRHMSWHALNTPELGHSPKMTSRGWYADSVDWAAGSGHFHTRGCTTDLIEGSVETVNDHEERVLADESQCACIFCGELFEDFYSIDRDAWMFKGAVYMPIPSMDSLDQTLTIIHANCVPEDSVHDPVLACDHKLEKDANHFSC